MDDDRRTQLAKMAKARELVRLKDGREGILVFVSPVSDRAKVRISGRHERVKQNDIGVASPVPMG